MSSFLLSLLMGGIALTVLGIVLAFVLLERPTK
jgi:hypothetical protein